MNTNETIMNIFTKRYSANIYNSDIEGYFEKNKTTNQISREYLDNKNDIQNKIKNI